MAHRIHVSVWHVWSDFRLRGPILKTAFGAPRSIPLDLKLQLRFFNLRRVCQLLLCGILAEIMRKQHAVLSLSSTSCTNRWLIPLLFPFSFLFSFPASFSLSFPLSLALSFSRSVLLFTLSVFSLLPFSPFPPLTGENGEESRREERK